MTDSPMEKLNLLDTEYADIIANSNSPRFELQLVTLGVDPTEARIKTRFITLLKHKPETLEEWEELMSVWEEACGYRPSAENINLISALLWDNQDENEDENEK